VGNWHRCVLGPDPDSGTARTATASQYGLRARHGEHGLNAERRLAYEEAIRIPLIVRYPRLVTPGMTPRELVLSVDLAPTLLALAGLTPSSGIQGRSLIPVLDRSVRDLAILFSD
jgi:arylsulfatase A-like enzyme